MWQNVTHTTTYNYTMLVWSFMMFKLEMSEVSVITQSANHSHTTVLLPPCVGVSRLRLSGTISGLIPSTQSVFQHATLHYTLFCFLYSLQTLFFFFFFNTIVISLSIVDTVGQLVNSSKKFIHTHVRLVKQASTFSLSNFQSFSTWEILASFLTQFNSHINSLSKERTSQLYALNKSLLKKQQK